MTNSKNITIALLGGAVVALLIALFVLIWKVDQQTASIEAFARQQSAAERRSAPSSPAPLAFPSGGNPGTPDFAPSRAPDSGALAVNAARKERRAGRAERAAKLSELQKDLRSLLAKSGARPAEMNMDELDAILVRLIDIQGNTALAGIDVQALRQNLMVAKEMQALARDLEAETRQQNPDRGKIQRITEKIQGLQKEIRVNVMAAPLPGGGEKK
ncbi:MAG: hypothetical protein LBE85_06855 [Candidatus Accumulibacter sp.]|jgi:hypothetical protein|nr:hypothetical protein [Accumulibacter sp.]